MDYKKIVKMTLENGGWTDENLKGYSVGLDGFEVKMPVENFNENVLKEYITFLKTMKIDNCGTWLNDGFIYLDAIAVIDDEKTAIELGRKNKQKAIYNLNEGIEITL